MLHREEPGPVQEKSLIQYCPQAAVFCVELISQFCNTINKFPFLCGCHYLGLLPEFQPSICFFNSFSEARHRD